MSFLFMRLFSQFHRNECRLFLFDRSSRDLAQKRKILGTAAAAEVSVAFGSPLGGVLFGLEVGLEGMLVCLLRRFHRV